jgi:hypothetical protein
VQLRFGKRRDPGPAHQPAVSGRTGARSGALDWLLGSPVRVWCLVFVVWAVVAFVLPISDLHRRIGYPDPELAMFWIVLSGLLLALSLVSGIAGSVIAGRPASWTIGTLLPLLALATFALHYVIGFHLRGDARMLSEVPAGVRASSFLNPACVRWTSGDEDCEIIGGHAVCKPGATARRAIECTQMSLPIWCLQWMDGCQIRRPYRIGSVGPAWQCTPGGPESTSVGCIRTVFGEQAR